PEQLRTRFAAGDAYWFGVTAFEFAPGQIASVHRDLVAGLRDLGETAGDSREAIGGNFEVAGSRDLVTDHEIDNSELTPIPSTWFHEQINRSYRVDPLVIRFCSPLRCSRAESDQSLSHHYLDSDAFDLQILAKRIVNRCRKLGIERWEPDYFQRLSLGNVVRNDLVWLDVSYGANHDRTTLGGAVGEVAIADVHPDFAQLLAVAQPLHFGENVKFGFGRYYLPQTNDADHFCRRSMSLIDVAFKPEQVHRLAAKYRLPPNQLSEAVAECRRGSYRPQECHRIDYSSVNGETREFTIPRSLDRALQEAIQDTIEHGLREFVESSSFANNCGLAIDKANDWISEIPQGMYDWTVDAELLGFVDSIDHDRLRVKMSAYIADPLTEQLIMNWIKSGAPHTERGLPGGSALSPALGLVCLDQLAEEAHKREAMLIRIGKEFLIGFSEQARANELYISAVTTAQSLLLTLNAERTGLLDTRLPFRFLGCEFSFKGAWTTNYPAAPVHLDARRANKRFQRKRI
ncbi:MAG: CRISPR system precrRNA processing endoribonuclease RAMP protein Cas6, partial [Planctomycetales bacterium]|nr:CRISPR system precrRNA processing endoribonuclease RAMP protein Cas6 [Planctomycetales bacterium]